MRTISPDFELEVVRRIRHARFDKHNAHGNFRRDSYFGWKPSVTAKGAGLRFTKSRQALSAAFNFPHLRNAIERQKSRTNNGLYCPTDGSLEKPPIRPSFEVYPLSA